MTVEQTEPSCTADNLLIFAQDVLPYYRTVSVLLIFIVVRFTAKSKLLINSIALLISPHNEIKKIRIPLNVEIKNKNILRTS